MCIIQRGAIHRFERLGGALYIDRAVCSLVSHSPELVQEAMVYSCPRKELVQQRRQRIIVHPARQNPSSQAVAARLAQGVSRHADRRASSAGSEFQHQSSSNSLHLTPPAKQSIPLPTHSYLLCEAFLSALLGVR